MNVRIIEVNDHLSCHFTIDLGEEYENTQITITDLSGKVIAQYRFNQGQVVNVSLDAPKGVYLIKVKVGEKQAVLRIVKD